MDDILFHRRVKFIFIDEDDVEERGGQTRDDQTITYVYKANSGGIYRKLLGGVAPVLPRHLAAAPAVNSVTLRVKWLPRDFASTGFIASAHDNLLVLCVGSYRDDGGYRNRRDLSGCYLVLDTLDKSVAVVPPLPAAGVAHYPIGPCGVAVLRTDADVHHDDGGGYLLAELYRHTDGYMGSYLSTNTATLFMWCPPGSSSGSGGCGGTGAAGEWIRTEVVLPLPGPDEDGYPFNFNPGTVFAASSSSLCWVDVRAGILVCTNISTDAIDGAGLVFNFIPLPEECAPAYIGIGSTEYRSMRCVDEETIKLLCMDDGGEEVTLAFTAWMLKSPLSMDGWRWEKDEDASCSSLYVADLLDDAIDPVVDGVGGGGNKHRLLRRVALWPVVGKARPGVAHVCVHDLEFKRKEKRWEPTGLHEVSLDVPRRRVASVFTFPAGSSPSHGDMLVAL